jgi:hypothetical protein
VWGYLASDGSVTKHTKGYNNIEFVSVSLRLLEDIQDVLFSLNIISGLSLLRDTKKSIIKNRIVQQKDTYHLRISHHSVLDLIDTIVNNSIDEPYYDHSLYSDPKISKIDFNNLPVLRKRPKDGCFFSKDGEYIYFQIKGIEHSLYTGTVYNFECDTHNYISHHISQKNCDPYDHDKSQTGSLGSTFIYKRYQVFDNTYNIIVAEYTGRPATAEEYYENVLRLLKYYNATMLYENEKIGIATYFKNNHVDYYLADPPDIISKIIKNSTVQRSKGIHMATSIKDQAEIWFRDWLTEQREDGIMNLHTIQSEPLLEEIIFYNDKGNFDRVMSMLILTLYMQELHNIHVEEKKEENRTKILFADGLFNYEHNFTYTY